MKWWICSAMVVGAFAGPPRPTVAQKRESVDVYIPYTQFALNNGLNVLIHRDPSLPVASVNLWYHVGSKNESPGRTGFAHLFEHIMFEGSAHVPEGDFDNLLESAGGVNNGSTSTDRTNYWENVPPNAVELALWLEADRMGWLLPTMTQEKLDLQRDVVKNERRESVDNQPYGRAFEMVYAHLYPVDHPYHSPGDRLDGRPVGGHVGRCEGLLPHLLHAQQREPGHRRRRERLTRAGSGRAVLR